jgi:hypothetical protein
LDLSDLSNSFAPTPTLFFIICSFWRLLAEETSFGDETLSRFLSRGTDDEDWRRFGFLGFFSVLGCFGFFEMALLVWWMPQYDCPGSLLCIHCPPFLPLLQIEAMH